VSLADVLHIAQARDTTSPASLAVPLRGADGFAATIAGISSGIIPAMGTNNVRANKGFAWTRSTPP
jgi:hypothetical protein